LEKRRVYQVAKEKKLSSDALISILMSMGHEVKSHMSVVTEEMMGSITRKIEEEKKTSIEDVQRQKVQEQTQKRAQVRAAREAATEKTKPDTSRTRPERPPRVRTDLPVGRSRPPGALPPSLPAGDDADRRRLRRRSRKDGATSPPEESKPEGEPDTKSTPSAKPPANAGSRTRGGRRRSGRRPTDARSIQDNVRKTLTLLSEGRTRRRYDSGQTGDGDEAIGAEGNKPLTVREFATVGELSELMEVRPAEMMAACLQLGVVVTINQRLDMDTIATVADEFGFDAKKLEEEEEDELEEPMDEGDIGEPVLRPPVVAVMGHVDHGKTSLLDFLRNTNVAEGESGGITQHIGAYVVPMPDSHAITFLDTPGHAAFTAMRARGARVTDLVIVVVAADDGVMPQTIEAIDHAKAAQVRIIVAINKIDLPTSDPERIKRELSERGVLLEDWGGNVSCAEMSAKTGAGVDKLLELVMLEAELLELKADPVRLARGTIVESQLDKGRGPVATVLVQSGTLRVGDPFVTGVHGGRVRALFSENMTRLKEAGPSVPVQVLGLSGVPQAGDSFAVIASEREAREITQRRQQLKREQDFRHSRVVTLGDLQYQIQQGKIKELNVVVKGDVDGSVEAINQELGGITHEEVRIAIIHSSVGSVSESDVLLASASNAVIVAFGVSIDSSVRELAVQSGVDIRQYSIIYEVIEELRSALSGLLSPEVEERVIGSLQVREVFSSSRAGTIAGCFVEKGKITRNHRIRVMRAGESLFQGDVASLRRFKDDVREVLEGFECGVALEGFDGIQAEDVLEVVESVESARTV